MTATRTATSAPAAAGNVSTASPEASESHPVSPLTGQPLLIVGVAEIADRLGVHKMTVAQWRYRALMPPAPWTVSGAPAWDWAVIAQWAATTGRTATPPPDASSHEPGTA